MRERCGNPKNAAYSLYGGRGITVCDRWRDSFEAFLADVGRRPSPVHSLDRIDNNLGYAPSNVRWAPRSVQQRNRRNNAWLTVIGVTRLRIEWSEVAGIPYNTLGWRLRAGWFPEHAIGFA